VRAIARFVSTTVIGGILFLVPIVLTVFLVSQAMRLAVRVLSPVAHLVPGGSIAGIAAAELMAAAAVVLACFAAGVVARTRAGAITSLRLERAVLGRVPGYMLLKRAAEGLVGLESASDVRSALARIEEAWVPAFVVERHANGLSTVFVPSTPTPAAGAIYLLEPDRVRVLDVPVAQMVTCVMRLGVGLRKIVEQAGAR